MVEIDFGEPERTNLRLNGVPIWSVRFNADELITVKDVMDFIKDYDEDGENPFDGYKFKINLNFVEEGWRTRSAWITTEDLKETTYLWKGYEDEDVDE